MDVTAEDYRSAETLDDSNQKKKNNLLDNYPCRQMLWFCEKSVSVYCKNPLPTKSWVRKTQCWSWSKNNEGSGSDCYQRRLSDASVGFDKHVRYLQFFGLDVASWVDSSLDQVARGKNLICNAFPAQKLA